MSRILHSLQGLMTLPYPWVYTPLHVFTPPAYHNTIFVKNDYNTILVKNSYNTISLFHMQLKANVEINMISDLY